MLRRGFVLSLALLFVLSVWALGSATWRPLAHNIAQPADFDVVSDLRGEIVTSDATSWCRPILPDDVNVQVDAIYTVTGTVTGPGGPLPDVRMDFDCCAIGGEVRTDANGVYTFTMDGPQTGFLIASPPLETRLGQATRLINVTGHTGDVDFSLAPGNLLAGRVIDESGLPARLDHDLYNSQVAKHLLHFNEYAEFSLYLPPDEYELRVGAPGELWENHTVDLRAGDVPFWEVVIDVADEVLPLPPDAALEEPPPLVERISTGAPNADGIVHLTGSAGAVPADRPYLDIINLHTGTFTTTAVLPDGSFEADVRAPYGSALQLRYNGSNQYSRASGTGAILWVFPPDAAPEEGTIPVYLAGRAGDYRGYWTVTGGISGNQLDPGDPFTATLDIMITGPQVDARFDGGDYKLDVLLNFERFFDADGRHHTRVQRGTSTSFTAVGLPIDAMSSHRWRDYTPLTLEQELTLQAAHRTGNRLNLSIALAGTLPMTMPQGYYRPALALLLGPDEWQSPLPSNGILCSEDDLDDRAELAQDENNLPAYLPVVRMGEPAAPRLPWALLVNTFSNGVRGTVAREERAMVGLSNRIAFQTDHLIVPPRTWYGWPISYRLEPFIPTLSSSLASDVEPYPPILPLKFPGGQLSVVVVRPDGSAADLGTAPFRQARNGIQGTRWTYYIGGDRTLQKIYEATTLSEQYQHVFDRYGKHQVTMTGTVEDLWGHTYYGGGTYDVWVAKTLDLEPAVFPGQPFEVGDPLAAGVVVQPSVPATITLDFTLVPGSGVPITYAITGRANRFGYFQPSAQPFTMPLPGEYVLDITAEYWDEQGVYWAGSVRGAGVVETPASDLLAHGLRGITVFTAHRPQWFLASDIHPGGLKESGPDTPEDDSFMTLYPYHTGDILWTSDQGNSIIADLSVQDPIGWYGDLLQARHRQVGWNSRINRSLEDRAALGELPLLSTTPTGHEWSLFPEEIDQGGYAYLSTQRPGVSVRGYVGTDNLFRSYWSTDYKYDRQLGNGDQGDLHNDIKLQYGGAVVRTAEHEEYLGYASMEVLIPYRQDELGVRTFPPFQGYSGGPDGGPILTLKGEEVDLFLTPTALRPGSVLEVGDTVAVAGTMWPTLESKGWFTLTAPSGVQHVIHDQANRFGYFYAADGSFTVDEPGVWTVEARLIHDAVVPSTGLAPSGKNTGDLLGARSCDDWTEPVGCGQFYFYVTDPDAPALALAVPRSLRLTGSTSIRFEGDVPDGWTNVGGKFTAIMSGYILEEGDLWLRDGRFGYTFDPWRLAEDFPNLDVLEPYGYAQLADSFTFSFLLSGQDNTGKERHRARSLVLQGQLLQAPSQNVPRNKAVFLPSILKQ